MDENSINQIVDAARNAQWQIFAGGMLLAVVYLVRQITGDRIPPVYQSWLSAVLGMIGGVAGLLVVDVPWYRAMALGLVTGATASGFWSLIGKHVVDWLNKKSRENKPC